MAFTCQECGHLMEIKYEKEEWARFVTAGEMKVYCIGCDVEHPTTLSDNVKAQIVQKISN